MLIEMQIELIKVKDLKPYGKNAKEHTEAQIEHLMSSIERFGFNVPLAVVKDNIVVAGNGRLIAAKKLKLAEVPCIRLDHLSKDDAYRAYLLAHNNSTLMSGWDTKLLNKDMEGLLSFNMGDFGFGDLEPKEPPLTIEGDVECPKCGCKFKGN